MTGDDDRASDRRPTVVRLLVAWLLLAPLLQALSLAGLRIGNFAPDRPWNYLAYGLAAPYVAWLVWRRRPRARFAAYVFLTHEAVRGFHFHRRDAVAIAALWVLLLQLPAARRFMPSLRPAEMRARWQRPLTGTRRDDAGATPSDPADAPRCIGTSGRLAPAVRRFQVPSRGKILARQSETLPERRLE